jgi:hypothetical protein
MGRVRKFLYSRWFFLFLAIVCFIDLIADVGESVWGWNALNLVSIAMDVIAVVMTFWIFADLQSRRPKDGNHPRR